MSRWAHIRLQPRILAGIITIVVLPLSGPADDGDAEDLVAVEDISAPKSECPAIGSPLSDVNWMDLVHVKPSEMTELAMGSLKENYFCDTSEEEIDSYLDPIRVSITEENRMWERDVYAKENEFFVARANYAEANRRALQAEQEREVLSSQLGAALQGIRALRKQREQLYAIKDGIEKALHSRIRSFSDYVLVQVKHDQSVESTGITCNLTPSEIIAEIVKIGELRAALEIGLPTIVDEEMSEEFKRQTQEMRRTAYPVSPVHSMYVYEQGEDGTQQDPAYVIQVLLSIQSVDGVPETADATPSPAVIGCGISEESAQVNVVNDPDDELTKDWGLPPKHSERMERDARALLRDLVSYRSGQTHSSSGADWQSTWSNERDRNKSQIVRVGAAVQSGEEAFCELHEALAELRKESLVDVRGLKRLAVKARDAFSDSLMSRQIGILKHGSCDTAIDSTREESLRSCVEDQLHETQRHSKVQYSRTVSELISARARDDFRMSTETATKAARPLEFSPVLYYLQSGGRSPRYGLVVAFRFELTANWEAAPVLEIDTKREKRSWTHENEAGEFYEMAYLKVNWRLPQPDDSPMETIAYHETLVASTPQAPRCGPWRLPSVSELEFLASASAEDCTDFPELGVACGDYYWSGDEGGGARKDTKPVVQFSKSGAVKRLKNQERGYKTLLVCDRETVHLEGLDREFEASGIQCGDDR